MNPPPRGPRLVPEPEGDGLDAASLALVLSALGAVGAGTTRAAARPTAEQRGPVFNWNEDEDAAPRAAASHKDGERSASTGPCKCGFKHWLKGIEYDWVIPVPTTVGILLLGYNKGEDPYDAAQRFIDDQKVKDSGLLDNSLVSNLVEHILASTEAGDEPSYAATPAAPAPAPVVGAAAVVALAPPSKEELDKREVERLKRERELRAEKDRADAQKLQVKKQIEQDKENRRREAEARRKAEEERRLHASGVPVPVSASSSSSVLSQPSPPSSQPVSPVPTHAPSTVQPVPRPVAAPSPWDDEEEYDNTGSGSDAFTRPRPATRTGGRADPDRFADLRREEWTLEDIMQVYRTEGQVGLLTRLQNAGFSPDELIRLLQYAAVMDQAERPLSGPTPAPSKSGSRSPEKRLFGGQGHSLRSSEPDVAFRGTGHTLRASDQPVPTVHASTALLINAAAPSASPLVAAASAPPVAAIVVDPTQPKTVIKIRLLKGQQLVAHFNLAHTILDIRRHIESTTPLLAGTAYELLLPPGKVLADHTVTIAKAGLQNATVILSPR